MKRVRWIEFGLMAVLVWSGAVRATAEASGDQPGAPSGPECADQPADQSDDALAALDGDVLATLINRAYRRAVDRVAPAVVSLKIYPGDAGAALADGDRTESGRAFSIGSGCLIDPRGYLVTSYHLVRNAGQVEVGLADGRLFRAAGIWTDPDTDLAVVRIVPGAEPLPVARFGDSDQARVGDPVLAIGSPFGLNQTVTSGIVSSKGRETPNQILGEWGYEDFIQTDAVINRGNSGGPLINLRGEIIGINANILTPTGYSTGYGFAVPSNLARWVTGELIRRKQVVRGYLGAALVPYSLDELKHKARSDSFAFREAIPTLARVPEGMNGVMVVRVTTPSPAAAGGLRAWDIIQGINGKAVSSSREFRWEVARQRPGSRITLQIWRQGQTLELSCVLAGRELAGQRTDRQRDTRRDDGPGDTPLPGLQEGQPPADRADGRPRELGISIKTMDEQTAGEYLYPPDQKGVIVTAVKPDSAAARAGLRAGMVLLEVNGKSLENPVTGRDLLKVEAMNWGPQRPELKFKVRFRLIEEMEITVKYEGP